jgi:hypothetical protein
VLESRQLDELTGVRLQKFSVPLQGAGLQQGLAQNDRASTRLPEQVSMIFQAAVGCRSAWSGDGTSTAQLSRSKWVRFFGSKI